MPLSVNSVKLIYGVKLRLEQLWWLSIQCGDAKQYIDKTGQEWFETKDESGPSSDNPKDIGAVSACDEHSHIITAAPARLSKACADSARVETSSEYGCESAMQWSSSEKIVEQSRQKKLGLKAYTSRQSVNHECKRRCLEGTTCPYNPFWNMFHTTWCGVYANTPFDDDDDHLHVEKVKFQLHITDTSDQYKYYGRADPILAGFVVSELVDDRIIIALNSRLAEAQEQFAALIELISPFKLHALIKDALNKSQSMSSVASDEPNPKRLRTMMRWFPPELIEVVVDYVLSLRVQLFYQILTSQPKDLFSLIE
jgi:hypothetical protein